MIKIIVYLFLLTPAMAIAGHYDSSEVKCLDCHSAIPSKQKKSSYSDSLERTCRSCHAKFHGQSRNDSFKHPIDILPSMKIPLDMPLNRAGQMTCNTCHTYHVDKNKFLLRRPWGKSLCLTCHNSL
ncbi:MAG TPA: cytochrome c3 family protein [Desulfuromonadaceae bacterium]|jgi:predicted CXXCH cytochrome family protein